MIFRNEDEPDGIVRLDGKTCSARVVHMVSFDFHEIIALVVTFTFYECLAKL